MQIFIDAVIYSCILSWTISKQIICGGVIWMNKAQTNDNDYECMWSLFLWSNIHPCFINKNFKQHTESIFSGLKFTSMLIVAILSYHTR